MRQLNGNPSVRKRCRRRMLCSSPAASLYTGTTISTSGPAGAATPWRPGVGMGARSSMAPASARRPRARWAQAERTLGSASARRQLDREGGPAALGVGGGDRAAVRVDDPGDDRQAEAGAALAALAAAL